MDGTGLRARLSAVRGGGVRGGGVRAGLAGALLLVACALVAAGCETAPPRQPESAPLSFAHLPPMVFDLGRIEVVERPAAPDPADAGHLLLTAPAAAARLWAEERLRASGSEGLLRVTIEEASARTVALATNTEFEDLFKEEQAERLDLHLRVTIAAIDASGEVRGHATADARRSRTLPEGITLAERERLYDEVSRALLDDYNASQEQAIRQYLHLYLR